jgi:hypothetical protein
MSLAILVNERSKINLALKKKEFSMVIKRSLLDAVTAKERLKVPFRYLWLKFKTGFFGLTLLKGDVL